MPKKEIKKSRSAEELITKPHNKQIQELQDQVQFESNKAQNYLAQITKLTAELDTQEQKIKELTDHNNELRLNKLQTSDQLGESWKQSDNYFTKYQQESKLTQQLKLQLAKSQKDLTITQQDLKSAQRVIELRLNQPTNEQKEASAFDYWVWIRLGCCWLAIYFLTKDQET